MSPDGLEQRLEMCSRLPDWHWRVESAAHDEAALERCHDHRRQLVWPHAFPDLPANDSEPDDARDTVYPELHDALDARTEESVAIVGINGRVLEKWR